MPSKTFLRARWLLLAAAALVLLTELGDIDLWAPDEPRIAAVAEEMRSGVDGPAGVVLLHLNGEAYTQKPPLYYWMAAALGAPGGRVSEVPARLPSALAGVAVIGVLLLFAHRWVSGAGALWGAGLLLTVREFSHLARRAQFDVVLTLFELLALVAFWRLDRGIGRPRANVAALHLAMGLAVLTKGPVGLLVPALVIVTYLAWDGRLRELRGAFPWWSPLLSIAPALAWLAAAVALAPPGYFGEAVGQNVIGRFFAGTSHGRPFYYYLYQFPADFLPWTLLWPAVWWVGRTQVFAAGGDPERRRAWRFLLSWVGASLVFFSLSAGKRGLYLLPAFPAAALLCGESLALWLGGRRTVPAPLARGAAGLGGVVAAAGVVASVHDFSKSFHVPLGFCAVLPVSVGLAALAWWGLARRAAPAWSRFACAVVAVGAIELAAYWVLYPALDPDKSPRPIAEAAAARTPPGESIGLVFDEPKLGGLAYYSGRHVVHLADAEDIRAFLAAGGRTLVVRDRKLDRLEAVRPVRIEATLREGRRSWVVVSPVGQPGDPAGGPAGTPVAAPPPEPEAAPGAGSPD